MNLYIWGSWWEEFNLYSLLNFLFVVIVKLFKIVVNAKLSFFSYLVILMFTPPCKSQIFM